MLALLRFAPYVAAALIAGAATWWLLSTIDRARAADRLELELERVKAAQAIEDKFEDEVAALRDVIDRRMGEFRDNQDKRARALEARIRTDVSNDRICFGVDTVRLLNSRAGRGSMPDAAGDAVATVPGRR